MSNTSYYLYQKYIKYGSQDWIPVYPAEYAISGDTGQNPVIKQENDPNCGYVPHDYSQDYLTFIPISGSSTFTFSGNSVSYSLDSGLTWTTLAANTPSPSVNEGEKILWKATLTPSSNGIGKFSSTGKFDVEGNAMSLLYGDNYIGQTDLTGKDYAFFGLFRNCSKLINAENLSLPATTLTDYCYGSMFVFCTSLTTAPVLSATTLAQYCYSSMFNGCHSLTTAPELPATTLAFKCYDAMFEDCFSLTAAPELSATTLADYCYQGMFSGCTSLTTAPSVLPATTLTEHCYFLMFYKCTSLTSAPELPATTLANQCYRYMFQGCTSLTTAPELPATILTNQCYAYMFYNCKSLVTAPELSATTLVKECYYNMFWGCTNLNYIKCLATDISASSCTTNWVNNVAPSGTFVKASSMSDWTTGNNGIPTNWTVQNA